jgi:hypothetical protein
MIDSFAKNPVGTMGSRWPAKGGADVKDGMNKEQQKEQHEER